MLVKCAEIRNPCTQLVGMKTGIATMENTMAISQKTKKTTIIWFVIPLLGIYPKKMKTLIQKDTCTPVFAVLNS